MGYLCWWMTLMPVGLAERRLGLGGPRGSAPEAEKRSNEEQPADRSNHEELRPDHVKASAPIKNPLRKRHEVGRDTFKVFLAENKRHRKRIGMIAPRVTSAKPLPPKATPATYKPNFTEVLKGDDLRSALIRMASRYCLHA